MKTLREAKVGSTVQVAVGAALGLAVGFLA